MNNVWYVQVPGQSAAKEYTVEALSEAVQSGTVPNDALTYSSDSASWRSVREVLAAVRPQLASPPSLLPPPMTAVQEHAIGPDLAQPPAAAPVASPAKSSLLRRSALIGAGVLALAAGLAGLMMARGTTVRHADVTKSVVQIDAGAASGTGFFVEGPDEWAYVATAFHVIDCGCPVSVARAIEVSDDRYYVEAYPDTEIVAYDADADLAILRLKNVKADRFHTLSLAQKPEKGEPIKAYGFPGRTLIRRQGLLKQAGEILSIGRFPVVDTVTHEVLRDHAVEGLLISASIESGYSGGPTCNERGEVVGITTLKDRTKTQHNGAVSVDALAKLLAQVKPAQKQPVPGEEEVRALIKRVEMQYLLQPVEKRVAMRPHEFIALEDRPGVQLVAKVIHQMDSPAEQADFGLSVAALSGHPLETYRHQKVQQSIHECEKRAKDVTGLLQRIAPGAQTGDSEAVLGVQMLECQAIMERPIAWDLAAMTLQWENKERDLGVTKVEAVDDDQPVYRASVTFRGAPTSFDVWIRREGDQLKLKLFDEKGRPYGLSTTRTINPSALNGTWVHLSPQTPYTNEPGVSASQEETLHVSAQSDGIIQVRHTVRANVHAPAGARLPLCQLSRAGGTFEQSFAGKIDGGAARLSRRTAMYSAPDLQACGISFPYRPDKEIVIKARDGKLVMYRTEGDRYPDEVEFDRR